MLPAGDERAAREAAGLPGGVQRAPLPWARLHPRPVLVARTDLLAGGVRRNNPEMGSEMGLANP
eukprot:1190616-Prorocentrum_minimum.AAC.1